LRIHLSFLGVDLYGLELDHDRFGEHPAFPFLCAVAQKRGRFYLRSEHLRAAAGETEVVGVVVELAAVELQKLALDYLTGLV
jgi:hypothetical protein